MLHVCSEKVNYRFHFQKSSGIQKINLYLGVGSFGISCWIFFLVRR